MKYFLALAYAFVTFNSIVIMIELMSEIKTTFDFIQVGAICTVWATLIFVGGKFIFSCLKNKR